MKQRGVSNVKIAQLVHDSAVALRSTVAERDSLRGQLHKLAAENKQMKLRMEAEKVAMDMADKGVSNGMSFEDLVESLEKKAHTDPMGFRVLREAVTLTGPDMFKTASIAEPSGKRIAGATDFEQYILGGVG